MPVGVTLSEMLDMLKAEANLSMNIAHGQSQLDAHKQILRRVQEELYVQHDWPSLAVSRDKTLTAGVKNYEFPDDMDFESVNKVHARNGSEWQELDYGIEPEDLNLYNSDDDFRTYPPLKWEINPDETRQFEVWPIPSQEGTLRLSGRKRLGQLRDLTDKSTLDATMIVLFAAAEILARAKAEDAQIKLTKAQGMFTALKRRQGANKRKPFVMGGGGDGAVRGPRVGIDFIPMGFRNGG